MIRYGAPRDLDTDLETLGLKVGDWIEVRGVPRRWERFRAWFGRVVLRRPPPPPPPRARIVAITPTRLLLFTNRDERAHNVSTQHVRARAAIARARTDDGSS